MEGNIDIIFVYKSIDIPLILNAKDGVIKNMFYVLFLGGVAFAATRVFEYYIRLDLIQKYLHRLYIVCIKYLSSIECTKYTYVFSFR